MLLLHAGGLLPLPRARTEHAEALDLFMYIQSREKFKKETTTNFKTISITTPTSLFQTKKKVKAKGDARGVKCVYVTLCWTRVSVRAGCKTPGRLFYFPFKRARP